MNKELSDKLNSFPKNHQLNQESKTKIESVLQEEIKRMEILSKPERSFKDFLKKLTIPISVVTVTAIGAFLLISSQNIDYFQNGLDGSTNNVGTAVESVEDYQKIEELSTVWAEALRTRDGKPRYEMMSKQAKEKFVQEQKIRSGENWNYNIGESSPWVVDYKIEINGLNAIITYKTQTSESNYYTTQETLTFKRESNKFIVDDYKTVFEDKPIGEKEQSIDVDEKVSEQYEQEKGNMIKWSSKNNEVILKPANVTNHVCQGVTVAVNGVKKGFNWSFSTLEESKPQVFYTDVTGDGNEEAIIIVNKGKGTGLSIDELHVLNSKDLSEIKVQNYEEILAEHVETNVNQNGEILEIKVNVQGKVTKFDYNFNAGSNFNQDELAFGGVVLYTLEDQKIKLNIPGSVGVSPTYVGDFDIVYQFETSKNEFIVDQIEFIPFDN